MVMIVPVPHKKKQPSSPSLPPSLFSYRPALKVIDFLKLVPHCLGGEGGELEKRALAALPPQA